MTYGYLVRNQIFWKRKLRPELKVVTSSVHIILSGLDMSPEAQFSQ